MGNTKLIVINQRATFSSVITHYTFGMIKHLLRASICLQICFKSNQFVVPDENEARGIDDKLFVHVDALSGAMEQLVNKIEQMQSNINNLSRALDYEAKNHAAENCPDEWTVYGQKCYYYSILRKRWVDAESTCEHFGGHLVTIDNINEESYLEMFIMDSRTRASDWSLNYTWVGGLDFIKEGHWLWVTGKPITTTSFTNWRGGAPNNGRHGVHDEDCMDWSFGWNDNNCYESFNFVCEKSL